MPGGTGTWRLTSIRIRSPLEKTQTARPTMRTSPPLRAAQGGDQVENGHHSRDRSARTAASAKTS